jgi:hypothetical protein
MATRSTSFKSKVASLFQSYEVTPLTLAESDRLFEFQLSMSNPKQIGPATLYMMDVAPSVKTTLKATYKLNEMGVLLSSRNSGGRGVDDIIVTDAIPANFSKKMKLLAVPQQKRLIVLLFEWEEELIRWRVLEDEMNELKTIILEERNEGNTNVGHLEIRLVELKGLWRLKPSLRIQRETQPREPLPDYHVTGEGHV